MTNQTMSSNMVRSGVPLHDQNVQIVVVGAKKLVAVYDAVGGPEMPFGSGPFAGGPTRPGEFIVAGITKHVSHQWPFSRIAWGTPLKDDGKTIFVLINGIWKDQKSLTGFSREAVVQRYIDLTNDLWVKLPVESWVFNDFGHITIYYAKDVNQNGVFDQETESISNQMIHTTPQNEYQTLNKMPVVLDLSHGCIHLKPNDIDEMIQKKYLKRGTMVYIYPYDLKPMTIGKTEAGMPPISVHFFPGINKIFVKGN